MQPRSLNKSRTHKAHFCEPSACDLFGCTREPSRIYEYEIFVCVEINKISIFVGGRNTTPSAPWHTVSCFLWMIKSRRDAELIGGQGDGQRGLGKECAKRFRKVIVVVVMVVVVVIEVSLVCVLGVCSGNKTPSRLRYFVSSGNCLLPFCGG